MASDGRSVKAPRTTAIDSKRFEIEPNVSGKAIALSALGETLELSVTIFDEDWPSSDDNLGTATKALSIDALRGPNELPTSGTTPYMTFTRWWIGPIRNKNGAEYAVEVQMQAGPWVN